MINSCEEKRWCLEDQRFFDTVKFTDVGDIYLCDNKNIDIIRTYIRKKKRIKYK